MKMLLSTLDPPRGRCLLLAHQLRQATSMADGECMHMAQRLFDGQHPREHPAIIDISETRSTNDLEAICAEVGISVEIAER